MLLQTERNPVFVRMQDASRFPFSRRCSGSTTTLTGINALTEKAGMNKTQKKRIQWTSLARLGIHMYQRKINFWQALLEVFYCVCSRMSLIIDE